MEETHLFFVDVKREYRLYSMCDNVGYDFIS
jgi:hypothetical protein